MKTDPKCACPSCHCKVQQGKSVTRNGKVYCSATCANECSRTTCLCVHDGCDHDNRPHQ